MKCILIEELQSIMCYLGDPGKSHPSARFFLSQSCPCVTILEEDIMLLLIPFGKSEVDS